MLFIELLSQDLPWDIDGMFAIFTWNYEDVLRVERKWIWSKINLHLIKLRLYSVSKTNDRMFPNTDAYQKIQKRV